ncbi:MAG: hypothetical protein COX43_04275 [Parcubacteria group bacterium CG23_combo_of_CG06-09_8_20_14_all_35_9]|nr:MAG: hypothetical protein COX43_04275 [Parcubacteria group bacterium CG23_combo_of_CG06-09_8_20_14_all_35_9]
MSKYYNARRVKNLFDPSLKEPFRLSRSKIELFLECPRCFYLDRRLGVGRPPGYPFTLNTAVDKLLKKEFDIHRVKDEAHPLMKNYKIDAIPFKHEKMDEWRDALRGGITYLHKPTNLLITGGIDDIWVNSQGELIIVDYKATAKEGKVGIDEDWQISFKRQIEIYQWLARNCEDLKGYKISDNSYFVYANGKTDRKAFDGKLEFDIEIILYKGDDSWVEQTVRNVHKCLMSDKPLEPSSDCDYCAYRAAVSRLE